jgi:isoamylase
MRSDQAVLAQVGSIFRGTFDFESAPFDWEGVESPGHHLKDLVIYEVPVRTFTASPSSDLPPGERGTYLGLAAKADHLVELGINAVEILPVFEYDEMEFQRDKNARDHMVNIWGYSHITFMAPMSRFAANGGGPVAARRELKEMVKTCAIYLAGASLAPLRGYKGAEIAPRPREGGRSKTQLGA